ncbi:hypothetical protein D3C84_865220 [compost metagenome]
MTAVDRVGHQPWVGRHLRLRHDVARVVQVRAVPVIGVARTDTGQVRPGAFRAPQERVIPHAFASHRVMPVAFGLGAERTDHLRVTADTAFADIDIATFQLQRGVGLHAFHRFVGHVLEEQRDDLGQAADAHGQDHQQQQQADVFLDSFVFHGGLLRPSARQRRLRQAARPARCARCCRPSGTCR